MSYCKLFLPLIPGPGLRRMVLIDLPGIIATETAGIKTGTADQIVELAKEQMSYDNAIILCVQDGSVDAERSQARVTTRLDIRQNPHFFNFPKKIEHGIF